MNGYYPANQSIYDEFLKGKGTCVPTNLTGDEWHQNDWRNRMAEKIMMNRSIPILRIADSTVNNWDSHIGIHQINFAKNVTELDCTHFCHPSGVMYHWRSLLYNLIATI